MDRREDNVLLGGLNITEWTITTDLSSRLSQVRAPANTIGSSSARRMK
jgi:hypothetical protein